MKQEEHNHYSYLFLIGVVGIVAVVGVVALLANSNVGSALRSLSQDGLQLNSISEPEPVQRCADSDGKDAWFTPGYAVDADGTEYDYCTGSVVTDWYCTSALLVGRVTGALQEYAREKSKDCKDFGDHYGCAYARTGNGGAAGYCPYCYDSDPSSSLYATGYINLSNATNASAYKRDFCIYGELTKFFCAPSKEKYYYQTYTCSNGCESYYGGCNEEPAPAITSISMNYHSYQDELITNCTASSNGGAGLDQLTSTMYKWNDYYYEYIAHITADCYDQSTCNNQWSYDSPANGQYKLLCSVLNNASMQANATTYEIVNETNISCTDTDNGGKLFVFGHTYGWDQVHGNFNEYDRCSDNYHIVEHWCTSSGLVTQTFDCRDYGGDICSGGVCVNSGETCYDSDPANDPFVYGYVNGTNSTNMTYYQGDYCAGDQVFQFYCDGDHAAFHSYTDCANGCLGGACVEQNTSKPDLIVYSVNYSNMTWNHTEYIRAITIRVKNIGSAATTNYVRVYSFLNASSGGPLTDYDFVVPPLSATPGSNYRDVKHELLAVPSAGWYQHHAYVDDTYVEDEENEVNNAKWTNLYVYP